MLSTGFFQASQTHAEPSHLKSTFTQLKKGFGPGAEMQSLFKALVSVQRCISPSTNWMWSWKMNTALRHHAGRDPADSRAPDLYEPATRSTVMDLERANFRINTLFKIMRAKR